jgi:aspartate ammonia-lyase
LKLRRIGRTHCDHEPKDKSEYTTTTVIVATTDASESHVDGLTKLNKEAALVTKTVSTIQLQSLQKVFAACGNSLEGVESGAVEPSEFAARFAGSSMSAIINEMMNSHREALLLTVSATE